MRKDFILSPYCESDELPQHESIELCACYSFPIDLPVLRNSEQLFSHDLWPRKKKKFFLHHLRGQQYRSPAWKCSSHALFIQPASGSIHPTLRNMPHPSLQLWLIWAHKTLRPPFRCGAVQLCHFWCRCVHWLRIEVRGLHKLVAEILPRNQSYYVSGHLSSLRDRDTTLCFHSGQGRTRTQISVQQHKMLVGWAGLISFSWNKLTHASERGRGVLKRLVCVWSCTCTAFLAQKLYMYKKIMENNSKNVQKMYMYNVFV